MPACHIRLPGVPAAETAQGGTHIWWVKNITASSFLSEVRSKIKEYPVSDYHYYGLRYQGRESHGSSQIVVIMPDGDALVMMSSLNQE
ncbi:hypothetical protein MRX96_010801 [Rhipicephalus microplus]